MELDENTNEFDNIGETEIPVLPLKKIVAYPGAFIPLTLGRPKALALIDNVNDANSFIVAVCQRDSEIVDPSPHDLHDVGCLCHISKCVKGDGNTVAIVLQGVRRVSLVDFVQEEPYLTAHVALMADDVGSGDDIEALALSVKKAASKLLSLLPELPPSASQLVEDISDNNELADLIASQIEGPVEDKQAILSSATLADRLQKVLVLVQRQLDIIQLSNKITNDVEGELSKAQRDYYLRQQLKAIKQELGDGDPEDDNDLYDLEQLFEKKELPEEAKKTVSKELRRLKHMNPMQSEYVVARGYVENLLELPWTEQTKDSIDLDAARKILDQDHYGLEKVKKRILEYLAVHKLRQELSGPILCLVGPPGVGKTSLAHSVAKAMGREFVRASMGGVRDEAEIRGHRRTYVGAMPGRILTGMKKAGTINPVFILDEIDKLAHDGRGDPSSALLEVLDPEQNNAFSDHYINIPYDLSKVFFVTTANELDTIPSALRDRLEILEIPGYTTDEKLQIARHHLLEKQLADHGLNSDLFAIDDATIMKLIEDYTREAGVRSLNRVLASLCRAIAVKVADGDETLHQIDAKQLEEILGPARYMNEVASRTELAGVATGMAWTAAGGDILFIEATQMKGKGQLTLTGQLGDVMKESAQAALSYVRSQAKSLGISEDIFETIDVHIHVPAGATPKDGPSAGVTLLSALVSLFTNQCVRGDVAMTGEITLRGNVLPVGGIKEKVLAARRAGVKRIILPERNRKDLRDIPENCLEGVEFIFASRVNDVLKAALPDVN